VNVQQERGDPYGFNGVKGNQRSLAWTWSTG
jgi:hypothetical protein